MRALSAGLSLVLTAALVTPASAAVRDDTRYVDPLIGSAGGGNTYPGAVRPFGMISWSPTSTRGDQTNTGAANGYAYDATRVRGFSLTHVNGAGCHPGAAGDVPIMPHVGAITSSPTADTKDQVYASDFAHADEIAEAGRYRVGLKSGATADLSVTTRAGIGEFTFPAEGSLLFRVSNSLNGSEDAEVTIDPVANTVSGSVLTGAFCSRRANGGVNNQKTYYRLYFTASFDRPITAYGTWVNSELRPGTTTATGGEGYLTGNARAGKGSGGYVSFADNRVTTRVGISYTSAEAAERNLAAEIPKRATVTEIAKEARKAWVEQLRAVEVDGGTADERTIFYTALYHTLLQPNVISDAGSELRYGNFSGWDQYRAQTQLLRLAGSRWRSRIGGQRGRLRSHVATTVAGAGSVLCGLLGWRRPAVGLGVVWAALTGWFAVVRIAPGPRTPDEIVRMVVTSALIPPAACAHRVLGEVRHRRVRA